MNFSERKMLVISTQVYRRLLRVYPKSFVAQFEDQLVQTFGDLARHALTTDGLPCLLLLWMRILPDLAVSAIREHFSVSAWVCPPRIRLRWVLACTIGAGLGTLAADRMVWLAEPYRGLAHSLCAMLAVGYLQSAWAFKRPARDVFTWTVATTLGMFFLALPVRALVFGWPLFPESIEGQLLLALLQGTGIGLFQYLVLPKTGYRPWRWVPANALAFGAASSTVLLYSFMIYPFMRFDARPIILSAAAVYGCVTSIPLGSILGSQDGERRCRRCCPVVTSKGGVHNKSCAVIDALRLGVLPLQGAL